MSKVGESLIEMMSFESSRLIKVEVMLIKLIQKNEIKMLLYVEIELRYWAFHQNTICTSNNEDLF